MKEYKYSTHLEWTGDRGVGTLKYEAYGRDLLINAEGKYGAIQGTADPAFRGDPSKYNPEELFIASISSCHMLWYLHLCAVNNIVVTAYEDDPIGIMEEYADGTGKITSLTLHPRMQITLAENIGKAEALHEEAHRMCFLAQSCKFPISIESIATTE